MWAVYIIWEFCSQELYLDTAGSLTRSKILTMQQYKPGSLQHAMALAAWSWKVQGGFSWGRCNSIPLDHRLLQHQCHCQGKDCYMWLLACHCLDKDCHTWVLACHCQDKDCHTGVLTCHCQDKDCHTWVLACHCQDKDCHMWVLACHCQDKDCHSVGMPLSGQGLSQCWHVIVRTKTVKVFACHYRDKDYHVISKSLWKQSQALDMVT